MAADLKFGPDGALLIPAAQLGKLAEADPASMRLVRMCDDVLVCSQAQPGSRKRPMLYGDLRLFHVAELMALIMSMRKDGILTLYVPHARKVMFFVDGQVVLASSNVEDDRLGEVLWRRGYLTLEQLTEVHDLVKPGKKLGQVLTERGLLTPRQLYDGIREQVVEIVFSTFHFRAGEFVFVEGRPEIRAPVRLEMETRELIREGVRRVQEMTRLEGLIPDREAVLVAHPVAVGVQFEDHERHLMGLLDGQRTVAQVIDRSHLGDFEALKALARLLNVGQVDIRREAEDQSRERGALPDVLAGYAQLLRRIHQTLKVESPGGEKRIADYPDHPASSHQDVFRHVAMDDDGRLDVDTLFRNARRIDAEKARELSLGALRAYYDYAVFQAMDMLDDDACDGLLEKLENSRAKLDN